MNQHIELSLMAHDLMLQHRWEDAFLMWKERVDIPTALSIHEISDMWKSFKKIIGNLQQKLQSCERNQRRVAYADGADVMQIKVLRRKICGECYDFIGILERHRCSQAQELHLQHRVLLQSMRGGAFGFVCLATKGLDHDDAVCDAIIAYLDGEQLATGLPAHSYDSMQHTIEYVTFVERVLKKVKAASRIMFQAYERGMRSADQLEDAVERNSAHEYLHNVRRRMKFKWPQDKRHEGASCYQVSEAQFAAAETRNRHRIWYVSHFGNFKNDTSNEKEAEKAVVTQLA